MAWAASTWEGSAPRPRVYTGGCSTIHNSSGVAASRASVKARIAAKTVSYSARPRSRTIAGWERVADMDGSRLGRPVIISQQDGRRLAAPPSCQLYITILTMWWPDRARYKSSSWARLVAHTVTVRPV